MPQDQESAAVRRRPRPIEASLKWVALILTFAAAGRLSAQPADWRPLGPAGGGVFALSPIPASAGSLWAGTTGTSGAGVWKSIDGGGSWVRMPLAAQGPSVTVAADPVDPLTVYAGTGAGLAKSTDGGASWSLIHGSAPVIFVAVAPSAPRMLYEVDAAAYSSTSLSKSADAGASWQPVNLPLGDVTQFSLAVDPTAPDRVYASGFRNLPDATPFFISTADGGVTWQDLALPPDGTFVASVLVDPRHPSTLYAASDGGEVSRSVDGGASWQPASGGLPNGSASSVALDPSTGALFVEELVLDNLPLRYQIWKSVDDGTTWAQVFQTTNAIEALAVDAGLPGRVYAGALGQGMLVSDDDGEHWRMANTGLAAIEVVDVTPDPRVSGTLYAALAAGSSLGVEKSSDGGATWVPINQGMGGSSPYHVRRVVADPQIADLLYAATLEGQVLKSTDGGQGWQSLAIFPANLSSINDLQVNPLRPGALLAAGVSFDVSDVGSAAALSLNAGATWMPIKLGVSPQVGGESFSAAAFDPSDSQVAFVGGADGLFASSDGGLTWSRRGLTLPPGQPVRRLRVDTAHLLYAVLAPGGHTLFRSADAGLTWTAIDAGLPAGAPVRDLALDPADATLYAGTDMGVYRSQDGGAHWTAQSRGLGEARVTRLVKDPTRPGGLYAGTPGGIFVSPPAAGPCIPLDTVLCLAGRRFAAHVTWTLGDGTTGEGHRAELADGNGGFWFFSADRTELLLKIVDGGPVNGHFWVFIAGLSNVGYALTLTDTVSGSQHTYTNTAGALASFADIGTFGSVAHAATAIRSSGRVGKAGSPSAARAASAGCVPARNVLCVQESRFQVQVTWQLPGAAGGAAFAVPLSQESGAFWFFGPQTLELAVKVLDGRALGGHFWVFTAGLTNVAYTVTVTDTTTGAQRQYLNAAGELASRFHLF
jgi:photosystem II stability/assembly factor-like uncharacterized protein